MKKLNWSKLGVSLAELILGILLLVRPESLTSGVIVLSGVVLAIYGIVCIVKYFRAEVEEAEKSADFSIGLLCLVGAFFCIVKRDWFVKALELLALLYGIAILFSGCSKAQKAVNLLRRKQEPWIPSAASAGLSLVIGLVVIFNPFKTTKALWIFTGIGLILQAVGDLAAFFMSKPQQEDDKQTDETPQLPEAGEDTEQTAQPEEAAEE